MTLPLADDRRHHRLRWKARRGLLENDLLLTRFLDRYLLELDENELNALDELLQRGDNDLLDLLMGRKRSGNAAEADLVTKIQAA
jgi:antitoxin CptB